MLAFSKKYITVILIRLIQSKCGKKSYDKQSEEDISNSGGGSETGTERRWMKHTEFALTEDEIAFNTEGDHPGQAELWRDPADTSGTGNGDGGAGTQNNIDGLNELIE